MESKPDKVKQLQNIIEVVKSGYGGITPQGMIVDRREHPKALPIPKNTMMGCPEPKEVEQ